MQKRDLLHSLTGAPFIAEAFCGGHQNMINPPVMTEAQVEAAGEKEAVAATEARFESMRRKIGMFASPIVFVLILLLPIPGLTVEAHRLAAIMALVILLWVTEALPLPVRSRRSWRLFLP
jgi:hypothetical protein